MDQYASSHGCSTYSYAEFAASFINILYFCSPSSGFMVQGKSRKYSSRNKRGKHTGNPSGCHPIRTIDAPISIIPHFYAECRFCCNPLKFILASDRHRICWLAYPVACCHLPNKVENVDHTQDMPYTLQRARRCSFQIAPSPRGIQAWQLGPTPVCKV